MKRSLAFITSLALLASIVNADVVVTKNGSSINGKILGIDDGKVTVSTDFAGEITIEQSQIASLSTDESIYLTLESGTTYLGPVAGDENGITISSTDGNLSTKLDQVKESWLTDAKSPASIRQAAAIAELKRKWAYEAAFDLTGKSGNKSANGLGSSFRATLKGPEDKLEFFARLNYESTDDTKSADDARGGVEYSNNFGDKYNWYVRSEFGFDAIKDIDTMFTTAVGFGYVISDSEKRSFDIRSGLGYIYESYGEAFREETNAAGLDFGLSHKETLKWGTWVNRATYTPIIDDFSNFRFVYDTSFDLPLASDKWSTRIGVSNTYDSEADLSDKEELDTTYYIRMVLKWL